MSRGRIYDNVTDLIGNTPIVRLSKVCSGSSAEILGKMESIQPSASVKDRIGLGMIVAAEREGRIEPGKSILVEPTSGNTGISLACVAASRGYRLIITMPETMSMERRLMILMFGAECCLTPGRLGMAGAVKAAEEIAQRTPNAHVLQQFSNPANVQAHYDTTGPEIWRDTAGKVDAVVVGVGTGGTLTGAGQYLKEQNPDIKIYAVEPAESAVLSGQPSGPHKIQGIGAGFVPEVLNTALIDRVIKVHSDDAVNMAQRVAKEEGLMVGISSGATVHAAMEAAKLPEMQGKTIVVMLGSCGERYLSTALFEGIRERAAQLPIYQPNM